MSESINLNLLASLSYPGGEPVSRWTGWNMIVVGRATPSLSYFLECIIIIASCMRSVATSFRRWHATFQTRPEIDATSTPRRDASPSGFKSKRLYLTLMIWELFKSSFLSGWFDFLCLSYVLRDRLT